MKGQYINIDVSKLRAELHTRKLTESKASLDMGYNLNFLTKSINRGSLCVPAVVLLDKLYGIKRESYEFVPAPEPAPEPKPALPLLPDTEREFANLRQADRRLWQMTSDDLYRIICAALRHAASDEKRRGDGA